MLKKISSPPLLIYLLTLLSLLIALRVHYVHHGWVNNDFVLYYESARLFSLGAFKQGFDIFQWPFYSLLIAGINVVTGVELHKSAVILSTILFGNLTFSFLKLIHEIGGEKKVICYGALLLFSALYITGDVLPMLLRDTGAWGFFLLSILYFIRFYKDESMCSAMLWQLFAITAMLFRIEYVSYLILFPLTLFFRSHQSYLHNLKALLKAHSLSVVLILCVTVLIAFNDAISINDFGRLKEITAIFQNKSFEMMHLFEQRKELLANQVFKGHFDTYASIGLVGALAAMCITKCLSTFGWLNVGLMLLQKKPFDVINETDKKILSASLYISLVNMTLIVLSVFLLVRRYTVPIALIGLLMLAFVMHQYANQARQFKVGKFHINIMTVAVALMLLFTVKNIWIKQPGYFYQQDALRWLAAENVSKQPVFFNQARLRYYANAPFEGVHANAFDYLAETTITGKILDYDFLVLESASRDVQLAQFIQTHLPKYRCIKKFYNEKRKRCVFIYKKYN